MLINDEYHDKFKEYVRDLKDADVDWSAGKYLIERKVLADYFTDLDSGNVNNLRFGLMLSQPIGHSIGFGFLIMGMLVQDLIPAGLGVLAMGTSLIPSIYSKYINKKFSRISEIANQQRYVMGEDFKRQGTYVRGASRTCNLDQL